MLALTYHRSVPAFALVRASGGNPEVATSALSMLHLGDVPEPELPAAGWMRVLHSLSGICGSDLAAIGGHASLYLDPLTSYPFVPGHEVVGCWRTGAGWLSSPRWAASCAASSRYVRDARKAGRDSATTRPK